MKKKILTMCLVVALAATAIVGGTLAYFTDTDSAKNVMVNGNVKIKQNEEQRFYDKDGEFWTLGDFVQDQKMYPMVDNRETGESFKEKAEVAVAGDEETLVFNKNFANDIDKFVSVTNVGTEDAYVRTILAFETVIQYEENTTKEINLHDVYFLVNGTYNYLYNEDGTAMVIELDGTQYWLAECVYEEPVAPETRTETSLRQIGLTWDANNEVYDLFGETYEILAISQATQTSGFEAETDENGNTTKSVARVALDSAFGEITEATATEWFKDVK